MDKKISRVRRALRTRSTIKRLCMIRLCVYRTPRHIYAQVISADGSQVLTSASSLDKEIKARCSFGGNISAAIEVGKLVTQRALEKGVTTVAFDRSGFQYHGRIKALAQAAREAGLQF